MSAVETRIFSRLTDNGGVSGLVAKRVCLISAAQNLKLPLIIYQRVSSTRVKNSLGPSYTAQTRFQFDCYALDAEEAVNLAEKVRLALDGWQDLDATPAIKGASIITDRAGWEPDTDPKQYRVSLDFFITHDESNA